MEDLPAAFQMASPRDNVTRVLNSFYDIVLFISILYSRKQGVSVTYRLYKKKTIIPTHPTTIFNGTMPPD